MSGKRKYQSSTNNVHDVVESARCLDMRRLDSDRSVSRSVSGFQPWVSDLGLKAVRNVQLRCSSVNFR